MLPLADVVIVGKDFAKQHGAKNSKEAAKIVLQRVEPGTVVVCPWGEEGASYCIATETLEDVEIHKQNAYVPDEIVDSLGECLFCLILSQFKEISSRLQPPPFHVLNKSNFRNIIRNTWGDVQRTNII